MWVLQAQRAQMVLQAQREALLGLLALLALQDQPVLLQWSQVPRVLLAPQVLRVPLRLLQVLPAHKAFRDQPGLRALPERRAPKESRVLLVRPVLRVLQDPRGLQDRSILRQIPHLWWLGRSRYPTHIESLTL